MLHALIALLTVISDPAVTIVDPSGDPVAGASICTDSLLLGISGGDGRVSLPDGLDSLQVRALGFRIWRGAVPPDGMITVLPVPVPSGMVVTVTGRRGSLRNRYPATSSAGPGEMELLGREGFGGLSAISGGVFTREYGGSMPVVSISVRGSDPAHCGYSVDGHDVESAMDGAPGIELDPLVFGGMEVSRGSGSRFIGGGMAGTLNFLSTPASAPALARLSAGDDGSGWVSGSLPMGAGRLAMSLRRNTGASGTTGYSGTLLASGFGESSSYGLLASLSGGDTESPSWSLPTDGRRTRGGVDGWGKLGLGRILLSSDFRISRHTYESTVPTSADDTHDEIAAGLQAETETALSALDIRISARAGTHSVSSSAIGERDRTEVLGSLETGLSGDLSANFSATVSFVPGDEALPGAGLMTGLPIADSAAIAHAGVSLGFRRPTLNDLYWPDDGFARGNPDLVSERSVETEIGIALRSIRWMRLSVTGFAGESEDLIRWEPGAGGIWTPVNVAVVLRRGVEAEAAVEAGPLVAFGTLTLLDVRDNDPGSVNFGCTLPYVPDNIWSLRTEMRLSGRVSCSMGVRGAGLRFMNYSETSWMDPFVLVSAGISCRPEFLPGIQASISADNLLDEEYMETSGFQGRGRVLRLGLTWSDDERH